MKKPWRKSESDDGAEATVADLQAENTTEDDDAVADAVRRASDLCGADITTEDGDIALSDRVVKSQVEAFLLAQIAVKDGNTHGKGMMDALESLGVGFSPGTVYPALHELDDEGRVSVKQLVRTKEYEIADEDACAEQLEKAAAHHMAVGQFFRDAAEALTKESLEDVFGMTTDSNKQAGLA